MVKQRQKNKLFDGSSRKSDKEKESDGEETELFVRQKPKKREIPTIEKILEEGDTLQSLAIRYRCTIAELKRINNIHNENEIFAKPTIKIPHRPFTMALAGVHVSGHSSPDYNVDPPTSKLIDIDCLNSKLCDNILHVPNGNNEVNNIILNSHISQKPDDTVCMEEIDENCEEVCLLPQQEAKLSETATIVSKLDCNGADGNISWKALILIIVIVAFAGPLIVLYVVEHPDHYHHHIS